MPSHDAGLLIPALKAALTMTNNPYRCAHDLSEPESSEMEHPLPSQINTKIVYICHLWRTMPWRRKYQEPQTNTETDTD